MPRGQKCPPGCACGKHHGWRFNDPDSLKACKRCGIEKPLSEFGISKKGTATRNPSYHGNCRACESALQSARYQRPGNRERALGNARRAWIKRKYGISQEEYDDLLARQDGGCAICGSREDTKDYRLPVDHNHETGKIRGLLCHRCNLAIGQFQDDVDLLRKAIKYLEGSEYDS